MEQAPPPPPSTPRLYMTPQIEKRRDGLFPSLLNVNEGKGKPTKAPIGGLSKPYRTNSILLLQVKERPNIGREASDLQTLAESINSALEGVVNPDDGDFVSVSFRREGCVWKLELSPTLNGADKNYRVEIVMYANSIDGTTNYEVDTFLLPKVIVENALSPSLKGYKEAKEVYDVLVLTVRKAIVRLEFPEFPEGCKGRPFREVYQLNARVSFFQC
jgi:hypothetical protein